MGRKLLPRADCIGAASHGGGNVGISSSIIFSEGPQILRVGGVQQGKA